MIRGRSQICAGLFLIMLFAAACSRILYQPVEYQTDTSRYDAAFPFGDVSESLTRSFESIKRIMVTAHYTTYIYNPADSIRAVQVREHGAQYRSTGNVSYTDSKAGTATIISTAGRNIALLTSAHVVAFEDTIYHYVRIPGAGRLDILQSVSVKRYQNNLIYDLPSLGNFDIIVSDESRDLAILGARFVEAESAVPRSLVNKLGHPQDLELGSFVYVLGYPRGHQMINQGLVSEPRRDRNDSFLTNAIFNPGISGSPVLARRSADSAYEVVGIARGAPTQTEYMLVPNLTGDVDYEPYLPYEGEVFTAKQQRMYYGITHVVSANEIRLFIRQHHTELIRRGFHVSNWADDLQLRR